MGQTSSSLLLRAIFVFRADLLRILGEMKGGPQDSNS